jgi:hypothetical protein
MDGRLLVVKYLSGDRSRHHGRELCIRVYSVKTTPVKARRFEKRLKKDWNPEDDVDHRDHPPTTDADAVSAGFVHPVWPPLLSPSKRQRRRAY